MDSKDIFSKSKYEERRIEDAEYYKYIFKKTEKIVCAVFYILRSESKNAKDIVKDNLEEQAQRLLTVALDSLKDVAATTQEDVRSVRHELAALESRLRVASAAHYISAEYLEVFVHEIDSVQRGLRRYLEPVIKNPLYTDSTELVRVMTQQKRERRISAPREQSAMVSVSGVSPATKSRRERVLDVLKEKGEATIKDITDVIKDCSEKTIQRELIALISDNTIVREGERRWSKYKII